MKSVLIRDLLFADDCGLLAHTEEAIQRLVDSFATAARDFGRTISMKKTEVLHQPFPRADYTSPSIMIGNDELVATQAFTYLGSIITIDGKCDRDIEHRIGKANHSFGRLRSRVWSSHDIRLEAKLALYNAIVLSLLLYGCEAWTLYARHVKQINSFHIRCLRSIIGIKWSDYITNDEVCARAGSSEMRIILTRRQLCWAGHVVRMDEGRLPKQVLYGQLTNGTRNRGLVIGSKTLSRATSAVAALLSRRRLQLTVPNGGRVFLKDPKYGRKSE